MTKSLFSRFLIVDAIVILFCIIVDNYLWLINIQVAFISSMIISYATFYSYKNNVLKQVNNELQKQTVDIDYIDKIDDVYDLYSSDINEEIIENPTKEQILQANKPIKHNYFNNLKSTILSYASLYRIAGYFILIIGFFYLKNHDILHIYSYLLGFLVVPASSLTTKYE